MPSFSQRMGYKPTRIELQIQSIDAALRNSIWNCLLICAFCKKGSSYTEVNRNSRNLANVLYVDFFKKSIDLVAGEHDQIVADLRGWFFVAQWYEVYDFLEATVSALRGINRHTDAIALIDSSNQFLERELSAYRFVAGVLAPISVELEQHSINSVADIGGRFTAVSTHIQASIRLFSDRSNPDFRNSIKESICAVEAVVRVISGTEKATLGDALKLVDKKHPLHPALKEGWLKIYGYTSDEGGIRHSLTEQSSIDQADAYFMLVSCSAFCNFLIQRAEDAA